MTQPTNPDAAVESRPRSLSQQRTAHAYRCVQRVVGNRDLLEKYKQLARRSPADVQINGLGQTLAFWKAKWDDEDKQLYDGVSEWLRGQFGIPKGQEILQWIALTAGPDEYRRATAETQQLLVWIKRFAEGA